MSFETFSPKPMWNSMQAVEKTLTYTPVSKTNDNVTGDETLTDGTAVTLKGVFFKRDDIRNLEKYGQLIQDADAVLLVRPAVYDTYSIDRDDKITYDGEDFRVSQKIIRRIGETIIFYRFQCFRIS